MFDVPSSHALRGNYDNIATDYTIRQDWSAYSAAEHETWRALYRRQMEILPRYACREYLDSLAAMDIAGGIPDFGRAGELLGSATGWQIVAVPGLIPTDVFFDHLAHRRFPATVWIRTPEEMDYIVEPDVFHDFLGHVPLLMQPVFADYMQAYGRKGPQAMAQGAGTILARLYWYMVEFGLIRTPEGLRAYGAGILSSRGETVYCIEDPRPNRLRFEPERVMRTDYRIDDFQETYFVLDSFDELFRATEQDFGPIYQRVKSQGALPASAALPGDRVIHRRSHAQDAA